MGGKGKSMIQVPIEVKDRLLKLKASPGQPYWEVIEALLNFFEKHSEDKTELWKVGWDKN